MTDGPEPTPAPDVPKGRRFHRERVTTLITAFAGFFIINASNFGACAGEAGDRSCLVGNTLVTDEQALLLVYTPLVFGPLIYLMAALLPRWRNRMGLASQLWLVVAGLSLIASGFAVMGWGATQPAAVAFLVGAAGLFIGMASWRARQEAVDA